MKTITVKHKTLRMLESKEGVKIKGLKRNVNMKYDIELPDEFVDQLAKIDPDPDVAIDHLVNGGNA
jgi:hypothetical protein